MLRSILAIIFVLLMFIVFAPVFLFNKLLNIFGKNMDHTMLFLIRFILSGMGFIAGVKTTYIDIDKVPTDKACLIIGNHQSVFDIILSYPKWKRLTGYISKKDLEIPVLSGWMKAGHSLFLDRKNIKEGMKTILAAIENINNGISMVLFPEGTVNKTGHPEIIQEFKNGSFKIALKTKCPILPMVIANSNSVYEKQRPKIKAGTKVIIKYLDPIYLDELSDENKKNISGYCKNLMQKELDKLYAELKKKN